MQKAQKYTLWLAVPAALSLLIGLLIADYDLAGFSAIGLSVFVAFGIGSHPVLKSYQYTVWIIAAIVGGLAYPNAFLTWGDFDLRNPWLILIIVQLVMFGMGTQMSLKDFTGIKTMGKGVLVGVLCQFSIMPLVGFTLAVLFDFEPEIAAGVILIGSCSSGLASNVMVYLANANLTLSVTLTAVATLLAPIMTPFLMKVLAGTYVEINFLDMCIQIIKIVIVPIGAALLYDGYVHATRSQRRRILRVFMIALAWLLFTLLGGWELLEHQTGGQSLVLVELLNFMFGAVVIGILYYYLNRIIPSIHGFMPKVSMFGIVYFTTVTTAASRENILTIGFLLLLVAIMHNSLGYTFGYWISRGLGLDRDSSRTVALEVGLQNGGMASGLAGVMGKLATLGLASAIFSPWMNISGSVLANYWRKKKDRVIRKSVN